MHVLAITAGREAPSSRFRVRQHLGRLGRLGVHVVERAPPIGMYTELPSILNRAPLLRRGIAGLTLLAKGMTRLPATAESWSSDAVWLQKEMVPGVPSFEPLLKRPFAFDVDDAIWLSRPAGTLASKMIAERASLIMAGNRYLADFYARYSSHVEIVPTAVDLEEFHPRPIDAPRSDRFTVGWIGSKSTLRYLEALDAPLARFFAERPKAELLVICNRAPRFQSVRSENVRYVEWSAEAGPRLTREMNVGLMPLADDAYTRGKCSMKMLQYMASGVASLVSPFGMNDELLHKAELGLAAKNDDDWLSGLLALERDPELCEKMGARGRGVTEAEFGADTIAQRIADLFERYLRSG